MATPHGCAKHLCKMLVERKALVEVLTRFCNSMLGVSALTQFCFAEFAEEENDRFQESNLLPRFMTM